MSDHTYDIVHNIQTVQTLYVYLQNHTFKHSLVTPIHLY